MIATGQHDEAVPLIRQALEIHKTTLDVKDAESYELLKRFAALLTITGQYDEAELLYRGALEILKTTVGEGHGAYAEVLRYMADLLVKSGRCDEAESVMRYALEIGKRRLDEDPLSGLKYVYPLGGVHYILNPLDDLGAFLRSTGRKEEAILLFAQVLPFLRDRLGDDHPDTKAGAANYARLLRTHFPDDPALAELQATFGPDIGR